MSYLLGMSLGILSNIKKHSKVIYALMLIYSFMIFVFVSNIPDLPFYQIHYETGISNFSEPLYVFLATVFKQFGFSYTVFRAFLFTFCMVLLTKTFYDFSPYPNLVFILYLVYPFTIDAVQVRSFVATSIMVFSVRFIISFKKDRKKIDILFFVICLAAAICFHYSAVLLGVIGLLFFDVHQLKHLFIVVGILTLSVVLFIIMGFDNIVDWLIPIVRNVVGSGKSLRLIENTRVSSTQTWMFRLLPRIGMLLVVWAIKHTKKSVEYSEIHNKKVEKTDADEKTISYYNDIVNHVLTMSMILVLMYIPIEVLVSGDYERLSRFSLIMFFLLISRYLYYCDAKVKKIGVGIVMLFWGVYFYILMFFSSANGTVYFDFVFRAVMENNPLYA